MKSFALVLALLPLAASAATITVNSTADNTAVADGHCTLREAIANVNAAADTTGGDCAAGTGTGDTIRFGFGMPTKIRLTLGQLLIQADVSIANPAPGSLYIDAAGKSRVFEIAAGNTTMLGLTIAHGHADIGGGISVDAGTSLTMTHCVLANNTADDSGGAIYSVGTLVLTACTLTRNVALNDGGAIYNDYDIDTYENSATLAQCVLVGNQSGYGGGAIENGGAMSLTNCSVSRNKVKTGTWRDQADGFGGGIDNGGVLTLDNCRLTDNTVDAWDAEGGAIAGNNLSLTNCTLTRNRVRTSNVGLGGAISGAATLTGCTLNRNAAVGYLAPNGYWGIVAGGAVSGAVDMFNCTLADNQAQSGYIAEGGAIQGGGFTLTNCTVTGNRAHRIDDNNCGGGAIGGYAIGTVTNSIIADSGAARNCGGGYCGELSLTSGGHNLVTDDSCFNVPDTTDLLHINPQLAPLANNGGPTQTMALCSAPGMPKGCRAASPAINAGDDTVTGPPDNLSTDQRGLPRLSGAHVDIGAYELQ